MHFKFVGLYKSFKTVFDGDLFTDVVYDNSSGGGGDATVVFLQHALQATGEQSVSQISLFRT